jgi:hypothetical protein
LLLLVLTDLAKSEWKWLVQNWIMPLHDMFADAMQSIPNEESPEFEDYDLETCDGRITFEKFMKATSDSIFLDVSL